MLGLWKGYFHFSDDCAYSCSYTKNLTQIKYKRVSKHNVAIVSTMNEETVASQCAWRMPTVHTQHKTRHQKHRLTQENILPCKGAQRSENHNNTCSKSLVSNFLLYSSSRVKRPTKHIIGHTGDDFYSGKIWRLSEKFQHGCTITYVLFGCT